MNKMWHERNVGLSRWLGSNVTPLLAKKRNYAVGKTDCTNVLEGLYEEDTRECRTDDILM